MSERGSTYRRKTRSPPPEEGWTRIRPLTAILSALFIVRAGLQPAAAAEVAAGTALAEACAPCHGADGVSQTPLTPSLAGEPDEYVQWQLVYFRSGARKSEVMEPIAKPLDNAAIRNLGAYFASLPPPRPQPAPATDLLAQAGEKLAVQHRCRACHADNFAGITAAARLAGQREDVLLKALRDFKSGGRVGSGVASMGDVVYDITDDDMRALARYMATRS